MEGETPGQKITPVILSNKVRFCGLQTPSYLARDCKSRAAHPEEQEPYPTEGATYFKLFSLL
jgi:hypothetical protein